MKRLLITCITITLLLTGCTAQLGYRFADTFIEWRLEDYVELIADLIDEEGEARAVDVAKRLGVSGATVNKMVARLKQSKLVNSEPYRSIFLTTNGRKMADASRSRHHIVVAFLNAVGVDEATAWADAEGMEHRCSPETLAAFENFVLKRRR